ncbi:hypothetical protein Tco_0290619 [Tanacetum coccineum]
MWRPLFRPSSPNYVPDLEYPPSLVYVPYVSEPVYPEFMPPEDDVLLTEEQPLHASISSTADSLGYITEFDLEEDLKEDDEDHEEDPTVYPNDDDEEEESSRDDADDEEEDEDEDEEEEEHLAPNNSVLPPTCRTTARMSIRDQTPIPFPSAAEVDKFLAISTPPSSPIISYSSPLPQIPSLLVSSPSPVSPPPLPASPTFPLGYRAAMIRLRAESASTSHPLPLLSPIVLPHTRASMAMIRAATPSTYIFASRSETPPSGTPPLLPIPLPTPSPPCLLPSTVYRAGVSEVTLLPRKRLCIALGPRFEVGKSSSAPTGRPTRGFRADYRFVGTLDDEIRQDPEREDTDKIYRRLDNAQDDMSLMSGQLNMLRRDRHAPRTARLMESEARLSCKAWVQSMDASDTACYEVRALRTTVLAQQTEIRELLAKMAPKRTTRSTQATTTTLTTSVTDKQLKRLIDQGVTDVLAAHDAERSRNGKDNHDSGTGVRRQVPLARDFTYPDFMK